MLFDAMTSRPITKQSFPDMWDLITKKWLTPVQFNDVIDGITQRMISTHSKVTVPGFEAKADWEDLPWEILWKKALDEALAAKAMGLMAMHAFKVHSDNWYTDRTQYAGHEHPNRYYFKKGASE
ncbi:hypothetical protein IVB18_50550 (plasmid) [Bradyrhizobium sp. 186]|uniref:hypothetical protein n=1 Tax=Bradyrhizobium sp. 186 TaxID=2782654 RepID=UPI0020005D8A|nr:hypothetical protein [Bradyrhizobium sp. 186]UPK40865.1 hypothetical protein IVB18_50550 [Bradyrhizobium sp. 186]